MKKPLLIASILTAILLTSCNKNTDQTSPTDGAESSPAQSSTASSPSFNPSNPS